MRNFILMLALAGVVVVPASVASAQDARARTGASSIDRHPQTRPPKTADEVMSGLSTSDRARKLREADLQTRKAFGAYQSVVADARRDGDPTDGAVADVLAVQATSATHAQIARFGEDTDQRARELQNVDQSTRRAFDKFQAAFWRQQDLAEAAGADARIAAFGVDTDTVPAAPPAPADGVAVSEPSAQEPQDSGDQDN
jgi:hypothetical protein